jgi:N-acetylmuramoyl-L-alanine amidase
MARCPFAEWKPISGPSGSYLGGPFKIVHHTTEGSTAQGAFNAFRNHRSDPHFTVDATNIYQHIDTSRAARALRNAPGGVQTNRDSAIQIEVVGFAHRPKGPATLKNVQKLCNWIEETHDIPKVWPSGPPKPAVNGRDPGGHNRSAANWDNEGGHYGHSQVPENTHWDPAYTAEESAFVIAAATGDTEAIAEAFGEEPDLTNEVSRMPDHADPHGVEEVYEAPARRAATVARKRRKPPTKKAVAKRKTSKSRRGKAKSKVGAVAKSKRSVKKAKKGKTTKTSKKAKGRKAAKTRRKSSRRKN